MKQITKFSIIATLMLSSSLYGQEGREVEASEKTSFSLFEAKDYALEHNFEIKNARLNVDIAHEQVKETIGLGLPQINASGSFSNFINLPVQVVDASFFDPSAPPGSTVAFQAGTKYSSSGNLEVGQLIFNGSYLIGVKAVRFVEEFQANLASIKEEDILFNVIQAYEMVVIAEENKKFADSIVLLTEDLIEKQKNYLDLGLMKQEDMDQLNYTLLSVRNSQVEATTQLDNMRLLLKLSMGYPIEEEIELTETIESLIDYSNVKTSNRDLYNNLNYQLLDRQVYLTSLNVKNKKFANYPSLNGFFQQSYNAYRTEFDFFADKPWFVQSVWGLQLNIPIYSGGQRHAQTAQTKIKLLQDKNNLLQLEESLKFSSIQATNNLNSALNKYELQKENIQLARTIYQNALTEEQIGDRNSILVTQKQQQLLMSQAQYIGSLVDVFNAKLSIDKIYNNIVSPQ